MRIKKTPNLKVAITGSREIVSYDAGTIDRAMKDVVKEASVIYFGGAIGSDSVALAAALKHRGKGKGPKLIVVVPDTLSKQPRATRSVSSKADKVIELGNKITAFDGWKAYRTRNVYMVDRAELLVAFWNGKTKQVNKAAGTAGTIEYAKENGKKVSIIDMDGYKRGRKNDRVPV